MPLPLLITVCGLFLWQIAQLNERTNWVEHTRVVISQVHLTQRLLLDEETGLRGFLLTGSPEFLEPYKYGIEQISGVVDSLRTLTADNPTQQQHLQRLEKEHAAWRALAEQWALTERKAPGAPLGSVALSEARQRKALMDELRATTASLIHEEERLLADRRQNAEMTKQRIVGGGTVLLTIVGAFLVWYLWRLVNSVEQTYQAALFERDASIKNERAARSSAEALAAEITERSLEMERAYVKVRAERDEARQRLSEKV